MSEQRHNGLERSARAMVTGFVASVPVVAWAFEVGIALTPSHLLALVTIVLAAAIWVGHRPRVALDLATLFLVGFLAHAVITTVRVFAYPDLVVFGESMRFKAAKQLIGLGFAIALCLALRVLLERFALGTHALRVHYWTTVVVAALTLIQYGVSLWDFESPLAAFPVYNSTLGETRHLGTSVQVYGFPRVALTMVEPSRLGTYLLTGWALWLFAWQRAGGDLGRGWAFTWSGVLLGGAVLITGSRSAYAVLAVLIVAALMFRPYRVARFGLVAATLGLGSTLIGPAEAAKVTGSLAPVVAVAGLPELAPSAARPTQPSAAPTGAVAPAEVKRVGPLEQLENHLIAAGTTSSVSARHRVGSLVATLAVVRLYPWLGMGYGTSEFAMAAHYPQRMGTIVPSGVRPTMMGAFNTVLAETGILGSLLVTALVLLTFAGLVRAALNCRGGDTSVYWGAGAALAAYGLAVAVLAIEVYQFLLVWVLLSSALAVVRAPAYVAGAIPADGSSRKNTPSTWSVRDETGSMKPGSNAHGVKPQPSIISSRSRREGLPS